MTNEIATQQQKSLELINAQQEVEIMKLRFELQKLQAQKSSRLDDSLYAPALFGHYRMVAETLSKSSMIPNSYKGKPDDIFVAMAMGYQLGFPVEQSLQDIAVINGRPCVWGDGLLALAINHPDFEDIKEEPIYNKNVVTGYVCTVIRKGHIPHSKTFTIQDAEHAGLLKKGGAWASYPERMLQLRARSFALRDKFADALRGLRVAELEKEDSRIIEGEVIQFEKHNTQVEKLKSIINNNQSNESEKTIESESKKVKKEEIKDDGSPITDDDILEIQRLMHEKNFDDVRKLKAMDYFKVTKLVDLTNAQAKVFLLQLSRA